MNETDIWIFSSVAFGVLGLIWWIGNMIIDAHYSGHSLHNKFASLGKLTGKTFKEIRAVVGLPNSVSPRGDGKVLRQWIRNGYHIALLFDECDICLGIISETSV